MTGKSMLNKLSFMVPSLVDALLFITHTGLLLSTLSSNGSVEIH